MIARPKISRNERKTTEIGAFEVGNFAPFCCPGLRMDEAFRANDDGKVVVLIDCRGGARWPNPPARKAGWSMRKPDCSNRSS